eukprot:CAMPEP_0172932328 /NCGR_PEP_ID=MMETSP1075-20121228/219945_1 /TAXON_ID=2916 /ORGANISM="Ceratium fusus, Strain PA161109" /LENGTH=96 /DNA_ID=CAMNT_0013793655 /DNA_START=343 /DNA_END=634 /DNA_ORIENTATION=+
MSWRGPLYFAWASHKFDRGGPVTVVCALGALVAAGERRPAEELTAAAQRLLAHGRVGNAGCLWQLGSSNGAMPSAGTSENSEPIICPREATTPAMS